MIDSTIEYDFVLDKNKDIDYVRVKLSKKVIGKIHKFKEGWQYIPKGGKYGGEYFGSLQACQRSLEEE